ncbi:MAG: hypothetical protein AB7H86_05645 [Blastocatellales bacterium]
MRMATLFRLSGISALLAGLLRTAASFLPFFRVESSTGVELLYFLIDILILFGLIGIYLIQHEKAGFNGFFGFLLAMTGTALIVGPEGADIYQMGAMTIAMGMVLLAFGSLRADVLTKRAPLFWVVSTISGIVGSWLSGRAMDAGFFIAGIAFGLGFVIAGHEIIKLIRTGNYRGD